MVLLAIILVASNINISSLNSDSNDHFLIIIIDTHMHTSLVGICALKVWADSPRAPQGTPSPLLVITNLSDNKEKIKFASPKSPTW